MSLIPLYIKNVEKEVNNNSISCFRLVHLQALQAGAGWFRGLSKTQFILDFIAVYHSLALTAAASVLR